MLLSVCNFFRGYVVVEVTGFSVERFMNLASYNQIYLWDIKRNANGVSLKVSIKGFKQLKKYLRKTGCKTRILNKHGLPFKLFRYKKRKIFAAGIFFFVISLWVLSSFIWMININGTERINQDEILKFCAQNNFKLGSFKPKLNIKFIEQELLNNFSDISWINIKIKGTCALIKIKEIIPKQELIDKNSPCDVVATQDGLIVNIFVSSGTPKVKSKDIVREGDILVSNEVLIENDNLSSHETQIKHVHAQADVIAKTYHELDFKILFEYMRKKYTGNTKKIYRLEIFGKEFDILGRSVFKNYDKILECKQLRLTKNYLLPVKLFVIKQKEFIQEKRTRNEELCKEIADRVVTKKILKDFDCDSEILDKKFNFISEPDGLKVEVLVTALEKIGKEIKTE